MVSTALSRTSFSVCARLFPRLANLLFSEGVNSAIVEYGGDKANPQIAPFLVRDQNSTFLFSHRQ